MLASSFAEYYNQGEIVKRNADSGTFKTINIDIFGSSALFVGEEWNRSNQIEENDFHLDLPIGYA